MAIVAPEAAEAILRNMQSHSLGRDAKMVGEVVSEYPGMVRMETLADGTRILDMMFGKHLPRIFVSDG